MNKTIKKLDNNVIKGLTVVCGSAKAEIVGFEWLTHTANYSNFPASLLVTCVFDTNQSLLEAKANQQDVLIRKMVQQQLLKVGVLIKNAKYQVCFDTEEACLAEHSGDWRSRLSSFG
ncbi:Fis family transcriptional regulator [Paraglaciecola aquimarina]|uniref:Fis family transcriptional regulator n=1 Tax=Paraglaciecola aquimarina TaxID=1235557 RepID=A0ABU3SXK0_9ALTE|nr:Fis family transcriptional regulator [Paraglaciecola aquimarina]MDU0354723.1 Fis family transcriptional regulator [Paraglaciecola aquimarina]